MQKLIRSLSCSAAAVLMALALGSSPLSAQLTVSMNALTFPATAPMNESNPQTVQFTNAGSATLNVLSYGFPNSTNENAFPLSSGCGLSLPSGGSCSVSFAFAPVSTGTISSSFKVVTDAPTQQTATISLTGVGNNSAALQPLTFSPLIVNFADTVVGNPAPPITVLVSNANAAPVTIFGSGLSGPNAGDFSFPANNCSGVLAPGATCSFTVELVPGGVGFRSATLNFSSSSNPNGMISLGGGGIAAQNINFSPPSGVHTLPFRVLLNDLTIPAQYFTYQTGFNYTIDGSDPATSPTRQGYYDGYVMDYQLPSQKSNADGIEVLMPETIRAQPFYFFGNYGVPEGYGDLGSASYTFAPGTPSGTISTFYSGPPGSSPVGLASTTEGDLWVADPEYGIYELDPSGKLLQTLFFNGVTAIAIDSSDNLYIADDTHRVTLRTSSGATSIVAGGGTAPITDGVPATSVALDTINGLAVDGSGNVYLTDVVATPGFEGSQGGVTNSSSGLVLRVDASGTLTIIAGGGPIYNGQQPAPPVETNGPAKGQSLWSANSITVGPDGSIYFADDRNYQYPHGMQSDSGTVDKVDASGNLTVLQVPTSSVPSGLVFDKAGNLYFGDSFDRQYQDLGYIRQVRPDASVSFVPGATLGTVPFVPFPRGFTELVGAQGAIVFDRSGNMYYTTGANVLKYTFQP